MKSQFFQQTVVFGVAATVTAAGWAIFWPIPKTPDPQPVRLSPPSPGRMHWTGRDLTGRIEALESATTSADRLKAAVRLNEIPPSEIPKALEQVKLVENRELTLRRPTSAHPLVCQRWRGCGRLGMASLSPGRTMAIRIQGNFLPVGHGINLPRWPNGVWKPLNAASQMMISAWLRRYPPIRRCSIRICSTGSAGI